MLTKGTFSNNVSAITTFILSFPKTKETPLRLKPKNTFFLMKWTKIYQRNAKTYIICIHSIKQGNTDCLKYTVYLCEPIRRAGKP